MDSRRLSILSAEEVEALYGQPRFTDDDRRLYFDLNAAERNAVGAIHTASVAAHLVLQLGYFKAKRQLFSYEQDTVLEDLRYIMALYFPGRDVATIKLPSRPTRVEQQRILLGLFDYRLCDSAAKVELESKAQRIAMLSTQPVYILRELNQHMQQRRIVAPGYRFLQEMIGRVVAGERSRITQLLNQAMTSEVDKHLEMLLQQADEGMYRISVLKHEPKDFSYNELRREAERRKFFQPLHEFAEHFLAAAGLSNESGKYYASLVKFYTVYKLQRMAVDIARLYLLCFAYHRFRQINDNLIEAFIHLVDQYEKEAKLAADDAMQRALADAAENLQAAGQVLSLFVDVSILLYNNTSDIKPERHSTDTHGTNQVNFWILRTFGYGFAPRYRDLHKKMEALLGFQQPSQYGDFLIKPSRKTYDELIEKEWPDLRQCVQKALNRGEAYYPI